MKQNPCPCGSQTDYSQCCGAIISGQKKADTAEALMRSRYTAFTQANIDYIEATMRGQAAENFDRVESENWAQKAEWLGLEVKNAEATQPIAYVEFIAKYRFDGHLLSIHERSKFELIDGQWYYLSGLNPHKAHDKLGRNDICSCGSGKKYKRCCLTK